MNNLLNVLTVVFVVLKLTDVIDWSWWFVFLPTLVDLAAVLVVFGTAALLVWWGERRTRTS